MSEHPIVIPLWCRGCGKRPGECTCRGVPAHRPEPVETRRVGGEPGTAELREVVSRLGEQVEELRARLPIIRDGQSIMQEMVETLRWLKDWAQRMERKLPK